MNCLQCHHPTTNPKFCSSSCAATGNNKLFPKRAKEGACRTCGRMISSSRVFCSKTCRTEIRFAPRRFGPWCNEDERELVRMYRAGLTLRAIGGRLGRTKKSVQWKTRKLALVGTRLRTPSHRPELQTMLDYIATALYLCEGTRRTRKLEFCNSDPELVRIFVGYVRRRGVPPNRIHPRLFLHVGDNEPAIKRFWSRLLDLPTSRFQKTHFKKPSKAKGNRLRYGTMVVEVGSIGLRRAIDKQGELMLRMMLRYVSRQPRVPVVANPANRS